MIKVKVSIGWKQLKSGIPSYSQDLSIFNFTNTNDNIYNNKKYFINSKIENPDFWFILENTTSNKKETVNINPKNIYFLNSETRYDPSYFLLPSKKQFLNQFQYVYSPNFVNLNNSINTPPFLMWRLRGDPFAENFNESDIEFYKNYKPKKDRLLSVYCTNKQITDIQKVRLDFVKKLKLELGDDLHWYGTDIKTKSKIDGIGRYKYHLVIENQINNNFISEKLYDPFLGNSYPIYSGAPNASEFFNKDSFTHINLNDFNGSINKIKECIKSDLHEKNKFHIDKSKNYVLTKFNLIKRIDEIVENVSKKANTGEAKLYSVYPKVHFEGKTRFSKIIYSINKRIKKFTLFLEKFYS